MNLKTRTKNRGNKWERTQIRERENQNLETDNTRKTLNDEWRNKKNILNYETKLECCLKNGLDRPDEMENKQYKNNRTSEMTKRVRTDFSIRKNRTSIKKRRDRSRHRSEEVRTEIIISNIYETWETVIYKRLFRRSTL